MFHRFARRTRDSRGFTLIELLIVVAIIAILAGILIPNFLRARAQAQVSASKANLKNIASAAETYFVDRGWYPSSLAALSPNYLRAAPNDPCTGSAYFYMREGSPATFYRIGIDFPSTNQCNSIVDGLCYTPSGGLELTPCPLPPPSPPPTCCD